MLRGLVIWSLNLMNHIYQIISHFSHLYPGLFFLEVIYLKIEVFLFIFLIVFLLP